MIIAITPGPDMTLFVGRALSEGRKAGLACATGTMTGCVVHTILVAVGLSALILASPEAFLVLKIVGAGYLVWLAWQALRHGSTFSPERKAGRGHSLVQNWATGTVVNLMNPKVILFFMTFLPQFVQATDPHAVGKLFVLGGLFVVVSIPISYGLVFAADKVSDVLRKSPRVTRAIDYVFAGVFSAFAVKIITAQAK
jgi:threonine/homoserine/homoserine lactone efflux protein